jgi:predicted metal-dependent HD superfamily phosphohydrolase
MSILLLKQKWLEAAGLYADNGAELWAEIERKYTGPNRHYHTLQHLWDMNVLLNEYYKGDIPFATLIAMYYHDFEYNTLRNDNEKRSAGHAVAILKSWNVDSSLAQQVSDMILATAYHHSEKDDPEINIFLDADMAVLGFDSWLYKEYLANIRAELNAYPDLIFNRERKKFTEEILAREFVYSTPFFRMQFEAQAKINLQNELRFLM